ncbi:MAG: hypothetical protein KatS3mg062_1290 [Tepidiforma sp.]|nr:MAG: hypothetical protein KatS3mg062_1290 [Tepidiforma sp.]
MMAAARPLVVLSGLLVWLAAACSHGSGASPAPGVASVAAERVREDGAATLRSRVIVTFTGPARFAESRVPLASHFELRLKRADGSTTTVLVESAERSTEDRRQVVLTVDTLVTTGSVLVVSRKAFDPRAEGSIEAPITGAFEPAIALLASSALVPADPGFFDPPAAPGPDPAGDDAASMREALRRHLAMRGEDAITSSDALATYDAIPEAIVPSPRLRAALAGLTGTFAEPALTDLLTTNNCTGLPAASIDFREPPGDAKLLARVTYEGSGARVVSIHPSLRYDRFELLMPLLAHEAVHCDQADSKVEEVAATAFDTLLYLQLVAADPSLAEERTELARELRIDALALLNSGAAWPESVGILQSPGVSAVMPNTTAPYRSFAEFVAASYPAVTEVLSATEPLAAAYMGMLAAAAGAERGDPFDLRYLDGLLGRALEPRELVAVIEAFELVPAD